MYPTRYRVVCLFAALLSLAAFQTARGETKSDKGAETGSSSSQQPSGSGNGSSQKSNGSAEVQSLRSAYLVLAVGDHDYNGHRVHAMHALEKACSLLGTDISGDGKGKQPQPISDADLRNALSTIQQVRGTLAGKKQEKVVKHLDVAISDINEALKTK